MHNFHGYSKKHSYFEGWYLKQQKDDISVAFIPAFHVDENGRRSVSIQVIFDGESHYIPYKAEDFYASKIHFYVKIGNNRFTEKGMIIDIKKNELRIKGIIRYSEFQKLNSDIMGPFHLIPSMQCSHGVLSMLHGLRGSLVINGKHHDFTGGTGYIEKDFGRSFPSSYLWTQCSDWSGKQDCSLMAAVATIPFGLCSFTGCICAICYHGKEYRLATYQGARIRKNTERELIIRQGRLRLSVHRLRAADKNAVKEEGSSLLAPKAGEMSRIIKEHICCPVRYRFTKGRKVIFDFISNKASFESVQPY